MRLERLVFAGGVLVYLILQTGMLLTTMAYRSVPVETDDAYTYIIKATQMASCPLQNCPALNDLRPQLLAESDHPRTAWFRYREYHRAFVVYHPLHSVILLGLTDLGLSWDQAYNVIVIAGSIFIGVSIAYLLYALWGYGPAGIGMLLLAFSLFPGQGLHYVVPSNLSFGIYIFTLAAIIHKKTGARWVLLAGVLAMVAMHTTGRLYALVCVGFFALLSNFRLRKSDWLIVGLCLSIVALAFLLPFVISRPDLQVRTDPPQPGWNALIGLRDNLAEAARIVVEWGNGFGGLWLAIPLAIAGFFLADRQRRRTVALVTAVMLALTAVGLLYLLPRYPGDAFGRLWIAVAILLAGFIGQVGWRLIQELSAWIQSRRADRTAGQLDSGASERLGRWVIVVLAVSFTGASLFKLGRGGQVMLLTTQIMINKQHITPDPTQPQRLLTDGCNRVLYMAEVPMHYYFSRGAMDCGAVFYPAIAGGREERFNYEDYPGISHVVNWNPSVDSADILGGSTLALLPGERLKIQLPPGLSSDTIELKLENSSRRTVVRAEYDSPNAPIPSNEIQLPDRGRGWYPVPLPQDQPVEGLTIAYDSGSGPIRLNGLRLDSASPLCWTWDRGVVLEHYKSADDADPHKIEFISQDLAPALNGSLQVLADCGDITLAKVTP